MKPWFFASVTMAALLLAGLVISAIGSSVTPVAARELTAKPLVHIPVEGLGLLSIHVSKLYDTGMLKPLREALAKDDQAFLKRLEKDYGFSMSELERISFYQPTPDASSSSVFHGIGGGVGFAGMPAPGTVNLGFGGGSGFSPLYGSMAFVTTRKPYDAGKFLKAWKAKASTDPNVQNGVIGQFGGGIGFGGGIRVAPNAGAVEVFPGSAPKADDKEKEKAKDLPLDLEAPYFVSGQYAEHTIILIDELNFAILPSHMSSFSLVSTLLRKKKTGPLAEAFALAEKHAVIGMLDGKSFRDMVKQYRQLMQAQSEQPTFDNDGNQIPPKPKDPNEKIMDQFTPYEPLFPMRHSILTLDLDAKLEAKLLIRFAKVDEANHALSAAKGMVQDIGDVFTAQRKATLANPEDTILVPYYDLILSTLKGTKTELEGSTLTMTASSVIDAKIVEGFTKLPAKLLELSDRQQTMNNLIGLGTALTQYVASHNAYPNDIQDESGKAILSWRVELLQFMGEDALALYNKLDRTKPWDHPANKKLWDEMPEAFRILSRPAKERHETFIQAFHTVNWIGNDDPWLVLTKSVMPSDVTDGTSNTVMACEMATATNWMKPDSILLDVKKMPMIGDPKGTKAYAIFLDSNVRRLDRKIYSGDKLKALVTANGGEPVDFEE